MPVRTQISVSTKPEQDNKPVAAGKGQSGPSPNINNTNINNPPPQRPSNVDVPAQRKRVHIFITTGANLTCFSLRSRELQRLRQSARLKHLRPTEETAKSQIRPRLPLCLSHCPCRMLCRAKLSQRATRQIWECRRTLFLVQAMRRLPSTAMTFSITKTSTALGGSWCSISIKSSTPW